jgi:predicted RNase H-like HicB family nuclease
MTRDQAKKEIIARSKASGLEKDIKRLIHKIDTNAKVIEDARKELEEVLETYLNLIGFVETEDEVKDDNPAPQKKNKKAKK